MGLYFVFLAFFVLVMVCFGLLVAASAFLRPLKDLFPYLWRCWLWSAIFAITLTVMLGGVAYFAVPYIADRNGPNILSDAMAANVLGIFLLGPAYTVVGGLIVGAGFGVFQARRAAQGSKAEGPSAKGSEGR